MSKLVSIYASPPWYTFRNLGKVRRKGTNITPQVPLFSHLFIVPTFTAYIAGGVYFAGDQIGVSDEIIICDFTDPRFHQDVLRPARDGAKVAQCMQDLTQLSDVTLQSKDGQQFPAHRVLLAAHSSYFRTLFSSSFSDSDNKVIQLDQINGDILNVIVKYMYAQDINIPDSLQADGEDNFENGSCSEIVHHDTAEQTRERCRNTKKARIFVDLAQAASFLGLDELCEQCFNHIMKNVDSSNALEMMAFSKTIGGRNAKKLSELCFKKLSPQQIFETTSNFAEMMYSPQQ